MKVVGHAQRADNEDGRHGHLLRRTHLQAPDQGDREQQDGEVGDDVRHGEAHQLRHRVAALGLVDQVRPQVLEVRAALEQERPEEGDAPGGHDSDDGPDGDVGGAVASRTENTPIKEHGAQLDEGQRQHLRHFDNPINLLEPSSRYTSSFGKRISVETHDARHRLLPTRCNERHCRIERRRWVGHCFERRALSVKVR